MSIWFTSDLHIGHSNIIKYCDRPFLDSSSMDESIISNINSKVKPNDNLYILGDIAMGGNIEELLLKFRRINGSITVVAGNHDRCHPYYGRKHELWLEKYKSLTGIDTIIPGNTEIYLNGVGEVNLSHFPYSTFEDENIRRGSLEDKFEKFRPVDNGNWLICGHVHEKWRSRGRVVNVGLDAWGGFPVSDEQLRNYINNESREETIIKWRALSS